MCFAPQLRALFCTFSTSQLPRVLRTWGVFIFFTCKCASRHNGVHFFDIATSKSGPNLVCCVRFYFEMCFAPQRRALFRHLNFQKWSGHGVFCTFWLGNVLRATTAFNFSSLIWPAGSAPAALASLLFDPPEPQIIVKTQCFATFLPFRAPGSSFFWLFLFFLLFSESSHLCFSFVHIVGSLTSKLPFDYSDVVVPLCWWYCSHDTSSHRTTVPTSNVVWHVPGPYLLLSILFDTSIALLFRIVKFLRSLALSLSSLVNSRRPQILRCRSMVNHRDWTAQIWWFSLQSWARDWNQHFLIILLGQGSMFMWKS